MDLLFIEPGVIHPNLVYLALLFGLWTTVTAIYIPGTGIAEGVAFLLLGGALLMLVSMPTNWVAVILMVVGVSTFLVAPFIKPEWARYAEAGLILQALGGFFLFHGMTVSPLLIGLTIAMALVYNRFVLLPVMKSQKGVAVSEEELNLVGEHGRVVTALDPVGSVRVRGENWTARSTEPLAIGTEVVVISQHGLELHVEKAKREEDEPVVVNGGRF